VLGDIPLTSLDLDILTLLDSSAAFDTVDHATLLRRLDASYGPGGAVCSWFESYLDGIALNLLAVERRGQDLHVSRGHSCACHWRGAA